MFNLMSRRKDEEGVAMVIAVLVIIIAAGIMATMTIGAVSNAQQVTDTRNNAYYTQAVDTAVQNALSMANGPRFECENPEAKNLVVCLGYYENRWKKGKEGDIDWQWRVKPVTGEDDEIHYDVYALATGEGTGGEPISMGRKVRLERVNVYDYAIDNRGQIRYIQDPSNLFDRGLFADSSLHLQNGVTVNATRDGVEVPAQVATNGEATFSFLNSINDKNMGIDEILLSDSTNAGTPEERCESTENKKSGLIFKFEDSISKRGFAGHCLDNKPQEKSIDLYSAYEKVKEACLAPGSTVKKAWKSSEAPKNEQGNAILEEGCYESITVDSGAKVDVYNAGKKTPNEDDPAEVHTVGDYKQKRSSSIKPYGIGNDSDSSLFRLYSSGSEMLFENSGGGAIVGNTRISFTGLAAGHDMTCRSTSMKRSSGGLGAGTTYFDLTINGALACDDVELGTKTTINYDEGVSSMAENLGTKTIWEIGDYSNATSEEVLGE